MKRNYLLFVALYFVKICLSLVQNPCGNGCFLCTANSEILMTRTVLASVVCRVAVIAAGIWGCVFTSYSAFALSLASSSAGYSSLPELNQIF